MFYNFIQIVVIWIIATTCNCLHQKVLYNGLFSRGANFHKRCTPDLSRNFQDSEIDDPEHMCNQHFTKIYGPFVVPVIQAATTHDCDLHYRVSVND